MTTDFRTGAPAPIHYLLLKRVLAAVALLTLWELLPRCGLVEAFFIPPFSTILITIKELAETGELATHTLLSLERAFSGLLVATVIGLPLGLALGGWFPRLQHAVEPLMELFAQANPVVLAHIIVFFLGIGQTARIFIIAWLCVWPIAFSAISAIGAVDPQLLKAARSLGLGRRGVFVKVVLPSAAQPIFTSLRLAAGFAFIMLIASEMMGANAGLGWLVAQSQETLQVNRVFAGTVVITFFAVVTDSLLRILETWCVRWKPSENDYDPVSTFSTKSGLIRRLPICDK